MDGSLGHGSGHAIELYVRADGAYIANERFRSNDSGRRDVRRNADI